MTIKKQKQIIMTRIILLEKRIDPILLRYGNVFLYKFIGKILSKPRQGLTKWTLQPLLPVCPILIHCERMYGPSPVERS